MSEYTLYSCKALLDGTGRPPIQNAGLLVRQGQVVAAGPLDEVRRQAPRDCTSADYSDRFIMPGVIDAHVHIVIDPDADFTGFAGRDSDTRIAFRGIRNLKKTLDGGVTFIRDLGGYHHIDIELKKLVEEGALEGSGLLVSGEMITMTGGHAWKIGRECDGPDEVRKAAREQIKAGADIVKIMATGGNLTPGPQGAPQLSEEEIRAAVEVAHRAGKRTTTHAHSAEGAKNALRAGIDCIEHGMFLDEEALDYMAEHRVFYVPTLVAPWICATQGEEKGLSMDAVLKCRSAVERHRKSFQMAVRKGVRIAMGTDAGTPFCEHGSAYVDELRLMCEGGFTPMQAIVAATKTSAEAVGISEQYGTLEPGKHADFLVLDSDPLTDLDTLRRICEVYQGGKRVKRSGFTADI